MRARNIVIGGVLFAACGPRLRAEEPKPEPAITASEPAQTPAGEDFDAVLRIVERPGKGVGSTLRMTLLERADGESWIVSYYPEPWLLGFDGRKVHVTGARHHPGGQALLAVHYRIHSLKVVDAEPGVGPWLGVGPEQELSGKFQARTVPRGAKNEGDTYWAFVTADGTSYLLENPPDTITDGAAVRILARAIEPDNSFTARRGGDYLWVLEVRSPTP